MRDRASTTPVWRVVAEREVRTKLRDKAFLGTVGFTLALLVVGFVAITVIESGSDEYEVAATTPEAAGILAAAEQAMRAAGSEGATVSVVDAAGPAAAEEAVRDGDADAALLPAGAGFEVVGDDKVDTALRAALASTVAQRALQGNAEALDVDLGRLREGSTLSQRLLDPHAEQSGARSAVAFAFAIVFLMTALGFGMTISQSIVQEKESRVVEILAAAVPVRTLLWGKIFGNTLLALGQVVLISAVGVVGLYLTGRRNLLAGVGPAVAWYVLFFVLGFLALASLWSVAGALASRTEDLQSTTLPGQLLLFGPYMAAVLGGEQLRTVLSMMPIVSTMTMPGRMAEGDVPWWQIGVAIGLTVAAAVVFVRVGSRMYERTVLRTGGKVSYAEAFAAARD